MAAPSKTQVLALYRQLLRASNTFSSYNYRTYALRRVRDAFRENRGVEDPKVLEQLLNKAHNSLAIIQRQVAIGKMYEAQRTVVEPEPKTIHLM